MIKSMTAFARRDEKIGDMLLSWEIRTVNHRHLDIKLNLPEILIPYEHKLKEVIQGKLGRGRVDLKLTLQNGNSQKQEEITINEAKVKSLLKACETLASLTNQSSTLSVMEVLQWPGVMEVEVSNSENNDENFKQSKSLLIETLNELIANRESEGGRLLEMIKTRGEQVERIVEQVKLRRKEVIKALREKVMSKISELDVNVDDSRLEQELVYQAQRLDVDEEIDRLGAHIKELNAVLKREEPIGRRLDFLMQELNREANTLASKSNDAETTKSAVELKVLIEQMREQCLNVE